MSPIRGLSLTILLKLKSKRVRFTSVKISGRMESMLSWFKCRLFVFLARVKRVLTSLCWALLLLVANSLLGSKSLLIYIFNFILFVHE